MQWQQCDSRVSRLESLLQTLKLTIFRLETERQLDPSLTANLKQQLSALQQENEEEQRSCWREVMKLRDQLHQAHQERDDARSEVQKLCETIEAATAAKMDVALAADQLKFVKLEINEKFMKVKEQMMQESTCSAEAMKSHTKLLQRVQEMERLVEMESRQGLLLHSDCQVLRVEVQSGRQQLQEEKDRVRQLEEQCQQLKEQKAVKDFLISELKTDLKAVRSQLLQRLQEQDLLLKASRRTVECDLQMALTDNVCLLKQLEKLKGEHAHLLQSFSSEQETADGPKECFERVIERLHGELTTAQIQEAALRKELEDSKHELCFVVPKLEGEKKSLETQLRGAKQEAASLSSAVQSEQDENRRLMGKVATPEQHQMLKDITENKLLHEKGKRKMSEMDDLQDVHGPAGAGISLENILNSHVLLQEVEEQEQEVATFRTDRLQARREIRKHQVEVEKLQQFLTSSNSKNSRAELKDGREHRERVVPSGQDPQLESLQKALDSAKGENKRLTHSLEQAVLTSCSLQNKLDQYQAAISLRDEKLHEAQSKISYLCEELCFVKLQNRKDNESSMKRLQEISEIKITDDPLKTGQELPQHMSELGKWVSNQEAWITGQRSQQQRCRCLEDSSQKSERVKGSIRNLHEKEPDDSQIQMIGVSSKQVSSSWEAEMERWTSTIRRWENKRELNHIAGGHS